MNKIRHIVKALKSHGEEILQAALSCLKIHRGEFHGFRKELDICIEFFYGKAASLFGTHRHGGGDCILAQSHIFELPVDGLKINMTAVEMIVGVYVAQVVIFKGAIIDTRVNDADIPSCRVPAKVQWIIFD